MTFTGIRDDRAPGAPYFRTLPRFETAAAKYGFLNGYSPLASERSEPMVRFT
jgi:hypothetical protein